MGIFHGWPNLLNVRATFDKAQMRKSHTTSKFTHMFLLLFTHFVPKILYKFLRNAYDVE